MHHTPIPAPAPPRARVCKRYRADNTLCGALTTNLDDWCRQPGCAGFRSAEIASPIFDQPARGFRSTIGLDPAPLSPEEAYDVIVTRTARERFIAVHGGTERAAEVELHSMLEDMLRERCWFRSPSGFWGLRLHGFKVRLSPDVSALTFYSTLHAERSYSQVKAGVPSRLEAERRRRRSARAREQDLILQGPEIDEAAVRALDPATLQARSRALGAVRSVLRADGPGLSPREMFPSMLAADLRQGRIVRQPNGDWQITGTQLYWVLRADGQRLMATQRIYDPCVEPPTV